MSASIKIGVLLFLLMAGFLVLRFGLAFGGLTGLILCGFLFLLWERLGYLAKMRHYATMYENIYVVSNHPDDDREVKIGGLEKVIVNVGYSFVVKEVQQQIRCLEKSGNVFHADHSLTDYQRIAVLPLIYQDGEFINESWKEFKERVELTIKTERSYRHAMLKKADEIWYNVYSNDQNGMEWKKQIKSK